MPPRKKKAAEAASQGLSAKDCAGQIPAALSSLVDQIDADGGAVLGSYLEPLGGTPVILAALPIERVEPTPYQRDLSETHATKLATVIPKIGRFLDPIIVVRQGDAYWTPNGMHRLVAMKRIGAKAIVALVVPDPEIALRILALNTEKAHALKDKALEVIRMARALSADDEGKKKPESTWAFEFEEPSYLTLGICYEQKPRFSGATYLPILKRGEDFSEAGIAKSLESRTERAQRVLELDEAVIEVIGQLKEKGFKSPYLRAFVVARINPLRFVKAPKPGQKAPRADIDATIEKMIASAKKFDVGKVKETDLAATGGAPDDDGG